MKLRYHFIGVTMMAGVMLALDPTQTSAPDMEIPEGHTGNVTLSCHGETYQVAVNDQEHTLMDDTGQQTRDVSLKIDFSRGTIISWRLDKQSPKFLEDSRPTSHLEHAYNSLCNARPEDCVPVRNQDGSYELYRYGYMADDVILKGTSIMSPDLKLFTSMQTEDNKTSASGLSCKITAVYNPFAI